MIVDRKTQPHIVNRRQSHIDILTETEHPREECGVYGVYLIADPYTTTASKLGFEGIHSLQHRGEESAGIAVADGSQVHIPYKRMGLVKSVYESYNAVGTRLPGNICIGHTRYSTTGSSRVENAAPFWFQTKDMGALAIGHNGNITNAHALRAILESKGITFTSTTDSEVIGALISSTEGKTWKEKISRALLMIEGSFSLTMLTNDTLWAAKDSIGNRPLSVSQIECEGIKGFAVASESHAYTRYCKYQDIYEIPAGSLCKIDSTGIEITKYLNSSIEGFCSLELMYLMRADAYLRGIQIDQLRQKYGEELMRRYPPPNTIDYVTYIPESSKNTAEGAACALSQMFGRPIQCQTTMIKNRYGTINGGMRGFMQPDQSERLMVARNYNFFSEALRGKNIVLIDDSIIRGITTAGVITALRKAGVNEIHMRIPFPAVVSGCSLGTDISIEQGLIARQYQDIGERARYLDVDSLCYLTTADFQEISVRNIPNNCGLCLGCATGEYPIGDINTNKKVFE